ncbi:uncharacterized protein [Asterias amurensis]|uniref:uncharacterized protein n=1 Tax=Asterias amurensis TaxID=7602 RepID=UPI003AB8C44B
MVHWCYMLYSTFPTTEKLKVRTKRLKSQNSFCSYCALCFTFGVIHLIMADLLTRISDQLSPSQVALMIDQKSRSEVVINRRSNAFKKVVDEFHEMKKNSERDSERAKHLELDVTRVYAQLSRTRDSLMKEQRKNAELMGKSEKRHVICEKCLGDANEEDERYSSGEGGEAMRGFKKAQRRLPQSEVSTQKKEAISSMMNQDKSQTQQGTEGKRTGGVPHEEHELLIREAVFYKEQLTLLAKEKSMSVDTILETAEYNQIIKNLQKDVQEKVDQNEVLVERIKELCSQDSEEGSRVTELQFQKDKLQKRLNLGQVMIDTLSKRCEELEAQVKLAQKPNCDTIDGSKVSGLTEDTKEQSGSKSPVKTEDQIGSQFLSNERKKHRQQVQRLEEELQLFSIQMDQVMVENKQLFKDRQATERQREIFEDRYNKLMETLQAVQQRQHQCSNCRTLEQELAKVKVEFADLKEVNELVSAQMKFFEEDLRQEQLDMENLKLKHTFHIEQWKRNCQKMGQQVDLLMGDLQRERELRQRLQQQMNQAKPRHQVPMAASLGAAGTPLPRACSVSVPWFGSPPQPLSPFVEVDCMDGHNESPLFKSTSNGAGASSSSKSLSQDKVQECPRCKREFSADKTEQYQDHVRKCFDSS